jgi:ketosteroid isomerase-like protein
VHAVLANAYNTKDFNLVMNVYDAEGIIVPEPGKHVTGRGQFEQAVKNIMAIPGTMEIKTVYCLQTGDVAVGRSEWSITNNGEIQIAASGIELMKQQLDGCWKVLIDHAFGAENNLSA